MKIADVASNPTPRVTLIQSAKLSPTVVHKILITQNQRVTSGTLLSMVRAADAGGAERVAVMRRRLRRGF